MKTKKLDPHEIAPFDFFDLMSEDELEKWKKGQVKIFKFISEMFLLA